MTQMAARDNDSTLDRAERFLDSFHEATTDPSGTRAVLLSQRTCVDSFNRWASGVDHEMWRLDRDALCQEIQDLDYEVDKVLARLRSEFPAVATAMEPLRECLADTRDAIRLEKVDGNHEEVCRRWFKEKLSALQRLRQPGADWEHCRGCKKWFRDPAEFERHFFGHVRWAHVLPCGYTLCGADFDVEALERHIALVHGNGSATATTVYIDSAIQEAALAEAVARCRSAYQEGLRMVVEARIGEEGGDVASVVAENLSAVLAWLEDVHEYVGDPGGVRATHVSTRRFKTWCDAVYGDEPPSLWALFGFRLTQTGRALELRSDRLLAVASALGNRVLVEQLEVGIPRLMNLIDALSSPHTETDAFPDWECEFERVIDGKVDPWPATPPFGVSNDGREPVESCPYCHGNISAAEGWPGHFLGWHKGPAPGTRIWMSPEEHAKAVEHAAQECREFHVELGALVRQDVRGAPGMSKPDKSADEAETAAKGRIPETCDKGKCGAWSHDSELMARHRAVDCDQTSISVCPQCRVLFEGPSNKKYCNPRCKESARPQRQRTRPAANVHSSQAGS